MNGGTYSEALKAGFDEKQAGFFGRMSGETRDEAVRAMKDWMDGCEKARRAERKVKLAARAVRVLEFAMMFTIGAWIGRTFL